MRELVCHQSPVVRLQEPGGSLQVLAAKVMSPATAPVQVAHIVLSGSQSKHQTVMYWRAFPTAKKALTKNLKIRLEPLR